VRDFRAELNGVKCWDMTTEALFQAHGEPLEDCVLQNREELIGLCEFIERSRIRSYLEIGVWTGRLLSELHRLFDFDLVAACDHGWAKQLGLEISLPPETRFYGGDSASEGFTRWRRELGQVDLVLIDADHREHAVRRDFLINREFPHRFLAFHDICGARRETQGVSAFWESLDAELGLERSTMGIGIWSRDQDP